MNRGRFLAGTVGAGAAALAAPWVPAAAAATEDDLAFANFGASTELLLKDFYAKALAAKVVTGARTAALKRGRSAAVQHVRALSELLTGAGDTPPREEDFGFEWPDATFRTEQAIVTTGTGVLRALLGAYQTAGATATEPTYRVLYASLAASTGQQLGALAALAGRSGVEPFPIAHDLEAASNALEAYLG